MRRTDRLFELIQIIRDGRVHRAADLARRLEVSERTIYRDIETLFASGIDLEGERGVGYMLRSPVTLPPLSFNAQELEALRLAEVLVAGFADTPSATALQSLIGKVQAALPNAGLSDSSGPWSAPRSTKARDLDALEPLRHAIVESCVTTIQYETLGGTQSDRSIWPLSLECWGPVWTCTSWCERREDFRVFRVDRIRGIEISPRQFQPIPGRRLEDFLAQARAGLPDAAKPG